MTPSDAQTQTVDTAGAVTIQIIETPSLGDRSYFAHDGEVALVVDPQRDIDRVLSLAEKAGVRITHVFETHIHNDYVTGGLALSEATGAAYHVNAEDSVTFDRVPTRDGDEVEVSPLMTVRAIATPGHTYTHLSYSLVSEGEPVGVFTGGSLLFGATGRPTCSARATPTRSSTTSTPRPAASRRSCRSRRACCPPTGSAPSAPPARPPRTPPRRRSARSSARTPP
jgi:glyoxylase-like metal-dependent hydrolase (beta-lactamase superfamily II)